MEEMYIYRGQKAFKEVGIGIKAVQALEFQVSLCRTSNGNVRRGNLVRRGFV